MKKFIENFLFSNYWFSRKSIMKRFLMTEVIEKPIVTYNRRDMRDIVEDRVYGFLGVI